MIDIDKYEGTNWDLRGQFTHTEMADEVLLLLAEVKRLREELALYEKYDICHPDGTHCCDECLERNGFEVKKND